MKLAKILLTGFLMMTALMPLSFAESQESGNAVVNGIASIFKLPITMLDKASESLNNASGGPSASEDVVVSEPFDLDAETTG